MTQTFPAGAAEGTVIPLTETGKPGREDELVWDPLTERYWWGIREISWQLKAGFWDRGEELSLGVQTYSSSG